MGQPISVSVSVRTLPLPDTPALGPTAFGAVFAMTLDRTAAWLIARGPSAVAGDHELGSGEENGESGRASSESPSKRPRITVEVDGPPSLLRISWDAVSTLR